MSDDSSMVDDHHLAGEMVGLVEVLRGEQYVGALSDQLTDRLLQLVAATRVQPGGRLGEEQQARRCRGRRAGAAGARDTADARAPAYDDRSTEFGAIVMPPVPAWYLRPSSVSEHTAARALDLLGVDVPDLPRWGEPTRGEP